MLDYDRAIYNKWLKANHGRLMEMMHWDDVDDGDSQPLADCSIHPRALEHDMNLTSDDLTKIAILLVVVIALASRDDPRAWNWLKDQWQNTVCAWFARRRFVGGFTERRHKLFRIGHPDEHSPGIMTMRRDVTTGWWT